MMNEKNEMLAVKELGEKIGYGNMMSLASSLWAIDLQDKYGLIGGNFMPVNITAIKKSQIKRFEIELNHNKDRIRNQLEAGWPS